MSSREIKKVLFEMCRNDKNFPIYDLTKIIADYVYETPTKCVQTLSEHTAPVGEFCILKSGHLASGSLDGIIKRWENIGNSMKCIWTHFDHFNNSRRSLIRLKDGSIASGTCKNYTIRIMKISDHNIESFQTCSGHTDIITSIIELRDGSLVSGSHDHTIKIWKKQQEKTKDWLCIQTLSGHTKAVCEIIELKNGSLASGSLDETIKIWARNSVDNLICVQTLFGHTDGILTLIELNDGSIASGSYDHTIKIWA